MLKRINKNMKLYNETIKNNEKSAYSFHYPLVNNKKAINNIKLIILGFIHTFPVEKLSKRSFFPSMKQSKQTVFFFLYGETKQTVFFSSCETI